MKTRILIEERKTGTKYYYPQYKPFWWPFWITIKRVEYDYSYLEKTVYTFCDTIDQAKERIDNFLMNILMYQTRNKQYIDYP